MDDDTERDFLDDFIQQTSTEPSQDQRDQESGASNDVDNSSVTNGPVIDDDIASMLPGDIAETSSAATVESQSGASLASETDSIVDNLNDETDSGVFKRPRSPSQLSGGGKSGFSDGSERSLEIPQSHISSRLRRELKLHQPQKCLITTQKKKRPESDAGHLVSILKQLKNPGSLHIANSILISYLHEAGIDVTDTKVPRLLGAAAEHHSASLIQDAMQLFSDSLGDRKKPPPKKSKPADEKANDLPPASSTSSAKPAKRKKNADSTDSKPDDNSDSQKLPNPEPNSADSSVDVDVSVDDSNRSVVGKDEKAPQSSKSRKKEDKKDDTERSVLTLDLLSPVFKEHGYHVGRPPYFVN